MSEAIRANLASGVGVGFVIERVSPSLSTFAFEPERGSMHDHEPFLAAIRANPDDDAPRLIFADWLEDRDPEWADYIRRECGPGLRDRPIASAFRHRPGDPTRMMLRRLRRECAVAGLSRVGWRRGFIEGLRFWRLEDVERQLESLRRSRCVSCVSDLVFGGEFDVDGVRRVLASPWLTGLRRLIFLDRRGGDDVVRVVAGATNLTRLERLSFRGIEFDLNSARALARSPVVRSVRDFEVGLCALGDAGLAALMESSEWRSLRSLGLEADRITSAGVEALVASECFANLQTLFLASNRLGDEGLRTIVGSSRGRLADLNAFRCGIDDAGAIALAESPAAAAFERLALGGNWLADDAANALARSPYLSGLRELFLDGTAIGESGRIALVQSKAFPELRRLTLPAMEETAARALLAAATLPKLEKLGCRYLGDASGTRPAALGRRAARR